LVRSVLGDLGAEQADAAQRSRSLRRHNMAAWRSQASVVDQYCHAHD